MKISGVIFDLDGTLIDSLHCWESTDRKFLEENGVPVPEGVSEIMKKLSMREAAEYFINHGVNMTPEKITLRIEQLIYEEYADNIKLNPYVAEVLDFLDERKIPYCVATANYRSLAEVILQRYGICDRFKFICTCEETGIKKDDEGFYEYVTELLGTKKEETVVVEDSLHCIRRAARAGFITAAVYEETSAHLWTELSAAADVSLRSFKNFKDIF